SLPLPPGQKLMLTKEEAAIKERVLREKNVELSDEYLNWRRVTMMEFERSGDPEGFFRQYPGTTWTEAFTMSGDCAFDRRKLQYMLETQECSPKWAGEISLRSSGGRFVYKLNGSPLEPGQTPQTWKHIGQRFRMWEDPDPDEHYAISVDPALGIQGRDATAIQVVKIGRLHEPDEQVACWHGYESTTPTAEIAYAIGLLYTTGGQEPLITVEVSGIGEACGETLHKKLEYPNPYRWQVSDKLRNAMTNYLGWKTSHQSKTIIVTRMREQVSEDRIIIHDRDTLLEMKAFSVEGSGFEGKGRKDDLCMALCICCYCAHQSTYGQRAAASTRKSSSIPGRYVQSIGGLCSTNGHAVTWVDGDSFDPDWVRGVRILIGRQWCQIARVPGRAQSSVPVKALDDRGHWITMPAPDDGNGLPPGTILVNEFLPPQERVQWTCATRRRDFNNTAFSPIHDRPHSPEGRLYNEHNVPAEYIQMVLDHAGAPPEFSGDVAAHAAGGADDGEDAWMRY